MRAKEFIAEQKVSEIPNEHVSNINNLGVVKGVGPFYGLYRMMMVAAGHPTQDIATKSEFGDVPVAMPYTEYDKQNLIASAKKMGGSMKFLTTDGSSDTDDTHVKSPVPQNSGKGVLRK